ncbi:CBS domain-containing protein [Candidatus Woesearchaeota archaeon]|nr:CBS domain-containing protein [Candidatus Woesearchaeota archaeon]
METGYTVMDIMTTKPIKIDQESTAQQAAKLMKEKDVSSLIVTNNDELIGIITEEDFTYKIVAQNEKANEIKIKEIMTGKKELKTITPDKDIQEAIKLMNEYEVRRLPVVHNGELKGLLTNKDILKIEPTLFEITVDKIMLREEERKLLNTTENPYEE